MSEKKSKCSRRSRRSPSPCSTRSATPPPCRKARSPSPCRKARSPSPCRKRSPSPPKVCFADIYAYYKYRLLNDENLMIAGSSAYVTSINTQPQVIPVNYPVDFDVPLLQKNVDHLYIGSPFYVRESGIYSIFFLINAEEASQFCFFVNGLERSETRLGNNAGAGQLLIKAILELNKHDCLTVRNSESTAASVDSNVNPGGNAPANSTTFLIMKIAPLTPAIVTENICDADLTRKEKKLFCRLQAKLQADEDLMLKGFNVHGSFYTLLDQVIPVEQDIKWDNYLNVNGLTWDPLFPERITVTEDGVYKIYFMANVTRAAQMGIAINNIVLDSSVQGVNKGAAQISSRSLVALRKGDYITTRNHTSANGDIEFVRAAGGGLDAIAAITLIFKIAPIESAVVPAPIFNDCYTIELFDKFRNYLLSQECLNLTGSAAYISANSATRETLSLNKKMDLSISTLQKDISFFQGSTSFIIQKSGIYDLSVDLLTNQPHQITQFINDTPDLTTVSGRNSGGSRGVISQLCKYKAGDVLDYRNYLSYAGDLVMSLNAGGHLIGKNRSIILFYLSNSKNMKSMKCKVEEPEAKQPPRPKEYIYSA